MSRLIENRFEISEEGTVRDLYSEQEFTTISVPESYMKVKYKAGFIQPFAYDEDEKKAIVSCYEEIDKTEDNSEDTVLKEFLPLLSALETMHEMNLVYGNLEPKRFIHKEDGYYLKDFGIGKEPTEKNDYSAYEYFAFQGRGSKASDVYSVCAILYEIFTGIHLPNAETRMDQPDLEPLIAFGISEQTANAINKGLNVFADDRFSDMTEFMNALYGEKRLENFKNDWSILVRRMKNSEDVISAKINRKKIDEDEEETTPIEEEVMSSPSKKKYLLLFGGIGIVALLVVVFLLSQKKEPEPEPTPTIQMTALPVASGGAVDYSATGSAVTGAAVEVTEIPEETTVATEAPTPSPTIAATVEPTHTVKPTSPPSTKTPKPTKKPVKKTSKPTKKPVKKTPRPVVTKRPVQRTPRPKPRPTKKPKFQLKDDFSLE